jgi:RES domain-containing protein
MEAQNPRPSRGSSTLYKAETSLSGIIDLCSSGALGRLCLREDDLSSDDHTACQLIGGAAAYIEVGGILVPSSRFPSGVNLVIFTRNQVVDFRFDVVEQTVIGLGTKS